MGDLQKAYEILNQLYGEPRASEALAYLKSLVAHAHRTLEITGVRTPFTARDAMLITYGDQVTSPGEPPLRTLRELCLKRLRGVVNSVHILPFYPYSSDDGFSVMDYRAVDPALGTWDDVEALSRDFALMFDAVINHASVQGEWFQAFLREEPPYDEYFISIEDDPDLSEVVRPRALPLLTDFQTASGTKRVWTTFGPDQADLNYSNPALLLEIASLMLFYAGHGASFLRLDAIAYLWKQVGTPCIHLPQTHAIVQLFRTLLDEAAPGVRLITETNVPHRENVSYFGDGNNEAQLVYNFALPPLVLFAFHSGNAEALTNWVAGLRLPSPQTTFFNFLASHDGIGLNPVRGILTEQEIASLVARIEAYGGQVSYKANPDGTQSPYELNINYFDALARPGEEGNEALQIDRFIATQAILLALVGVPGIYFHSLFGSRGWPEGVATTGWARTINRQKLTLAELDSALDDPASRRSQIFSRYAALLWARSSSPAFDPHGSQAVLDCGESIFALLRAAPDGSERVMCLHNVTGRDQTAEPAFSLAGGRDLLSGSILQEETIRLPPYGVRWIVLA